MIIENGQKRVEVETDGEVGQSIDMSIDQDSIGLLMNFLSKNIYSDPIGSPIREWVSNAWDANVKAGVNNPIQVCLTKLGYNKWEFSVEDTALGLDDYDVENVIKKYLCSTKRDDNSQLGALGVGFKSGLAYSNSFTFRCRKNGKERTYIMYEGEFNNKIDLIHEQDTTEPNGVKMILEVKNWDANIFSNKIREQLAYFSNTFIKDDYRTFDNNYKIYENDLFKWSEISPDRKMHLCLGEVYYPMDFAKLGISDIHIPVAVKIGLEDKVNPTISRESLMLTPEAKLLINSKIKTIAEWFVKEYNKTLSETTNFCDAFDSIGNTDYYVSVGEEKSFYINSIIEHSSIPIDEVKVEGIKLKSPSYYKSNFHLILDNLFPQAWDDRNNTWKRKHISYELSRRAIDYAEKVILIDFVLSGNMKTYLREKHGSMTLYVEKLASHESLYYYKNKLWLGKVSKDKWRDLIKEFQFVQNEVVSRWTDERGLETKQEYIDWLAEKKAEQKANREKGIRSSNYKGIDKQKGQITLNIAREHKYDESIVFDKKAVNISNLHKLGHLSVLIEKDCDKELMYKWVDTFKDVKFVNIGEREIKHVKELQNFISMDEFKETRPFSRIATALYIEDILKLVPDNEEVIYSAFPKYEELKDRLEEYVSNERTRMGDTLKQAIVEEVQRTGNWDMNIYPECLQFKEIMSKFGFISFLNMTHGNPEELRIAKNMMYIMLKHQKIEGSLIQEMELVPIKVSEEAIIEVEEEALVNV